MLIWFQVWREACAPLYECNCSICERAAIQASGKQHALPTTISSQAQPVAAPQPPLEICIEEVHVDEGNKGEAGDEERESGESGDEAEVDSDGASCDRNSEVERWRNARKRSSAELDDCVDETGPVVEADEERCGKRTRRLSTEAESLEAFGNTERMKRRSPDEVNDLSAVCDNVKRRKSSGSDANNRVEQQTKQTPATSEDDAPELSPYRPSRSCRLRAPSPPTNFNKDSPKIICLEGFDKLYAFKVKDEAVV
jgi:hypothetical protein